MRSNWLVHGFTVVSILTFSGCDAQPTKQAHSPSARATANPVPSDAKALGPLYIGMQRTALESLPYKFMTSKIRAEDEEYVVDTVYLGSNSTVDATFWDDKVTDLTVRSFGYENPQGAKVGDTIKRLQTIYPNGEIAKGDEEGPYFSFSTNVGGQFFRFDTEQVNHECLTEDRDCPPDIGKLQSMALSVR